MRRWRSLVLYAFVSAIVMGTVNSESESDDNEDLLPTLPPTAPPTRSPTINEVTESNEPKTNTETNKKKKKRKKGTGITAKNVRKPKQLKVNDTITQWDATSCGRRDQFSGYVFVQHALEKDDDEEIDDKMLSTIAKGFLDTYNELNSPKLLANVCDKTFMRLVETVEVTVLDTTYVKTEGQELAWRNFLYNITGYGIGTTEETLVFERGNVDRITLPTSEDEDELPCTCLPYLLEEQRAPTEEEFKKAFTKKIKYLSYIGKLKNVKDVNKVIEYDAVDCKGWEKDFNSDVELEFSVDPTKKDYDILQDAFLNSYNQLNVNYCDPNFRHVTHVEIEGKDNNDRLLRGAEPCDRLCKKKKKKRRKLRFKVNFRCKGCKKKTRMFDDVNARRLDENDGEEERDKEPVRNESTKGRALDHEDGKWDWLDKFDWHHLFEGEDRCFCASHPKALRAPTNEEFAKRYTTTLQAADVSYDYRIKQVTETVVKSSYKRGGD